MPVVIGTVVVWLSSVAAAVASESRRGRTLIRPDELEDGPSGTPRDVIRAIATEITQQAPPERQDALHRVLLSELSRGNQRGAQLVVPVDVDGAPSGDSIRRVARAVADAWGSTAIVTDRSITSGDSGGEYPAVLITVGDLPQDVSWIGGSRDVGRDSYGGIVDSIVQTVVSSAVGTVTSMGVQSLVASAGGERRLARLARRYESALERGDRASVEAIRQKLTRSASRIKGRKVDWSEIESIIA